MNAVLKGDYSTGPYGQSIREFNFAWPDDGGARIEVIVDPNWLIAGNPRVVRRVAWRSCMCCTRRFFSQDIARIRMCDPCKATKTYKSSYG